MLAAVLCWAVAATGTVPALAVAGGLLATAVALVVAIRGQAAARR
jgi:hypothetical protein